jgi:putative ABC transport system permease protein
VGAVSYLLIRRARLPGVQAHSVVRLAFGALQRHAALNALQTLVFSLCLMLALLLVLVRTALLQDWQRQLPPGTPNHFLLNVAPYQVEPVQQFLEARGLRHAGLYPMVPGRVLELNDQPARTLPGEELNLDRDWNLAWSDTPPEDNRIVAGRWWGADAGDEVSVEAGVARSLGIGIGDRMLVQVGTHRIEARVSSIRELDWDTMRPNFFLIFPRHLLEAQAAMWITSFHQPPGSPAIVNALLREFPTISVIEMEAVLQQVRSVTAQLSLAVELVLGLLLGAGVLVVLASVQAGLEARLRESAILRALGARRQLVLGSLALEFALLGLLAGVLATAGAEAAAWFVQTRLMELDATLHPVLWIAGPVAGALVSGLLGLLACRRAVETPPVVVLREAA